MTEGTAYMSRKIKPAKAAQAATYSIPEVATLLGVGKNAAYNAGANSDRREIPPLGRHVVPKISIDRMLGRDTNTQN
jgi:hypothetical protein